MTDRLSELEARCAAQAEALRRIEARLSALERAAAAPHARTGRARPARPADDLAQARSDLTAVVGSVSLVGRTLLVLAGAFVLRALTDAGALPAAVGVVLGLAYAGTFVALADRAGRAGTARGASAGFHGAAAVLVGFPLLVEAASRLRLLPTATASALLAALTAAALAVAVRRRLHALAWIVTLGGVAAAVALAGTTGWLVPPALYLVALGVATLWIGYVVDWRALRSPVAVAADLAVGVLAFRALAAGAPEGPVAALSVQVVLVAAYLGSVAARTLLLGRRVVPFEIVQGVAAIAVGLGGAAAVAVRSGTGAAGVGASSLVLGLAAYGVAFAFVERRQSHRGNFYFYASLGLLLVVAGAALLLPVGALGMATAVLGLGAAALARRLRRLSLAGHAAAYAVVAAAAAGLLSHAAEAILASPWTPWTAVPPVGLLVLAAGAATAWLCAGVARARPVERLPQLALVAVVAACAAGVAIGWAVPVVAGSPGRDAAPGAVAAARTALLVGAILAAAGLGRREAWVEAGWLAVPALAAVGLKILLEDLPRGRPATLVAGFACYGAALILVPRLRRRTRAAEPA